MSSIGQILQNLWEQSGFFLLSGDWRQLLMIGLAFLLLYLGIVKKFEPLLLVGIAFGMLLTNLPDLVCSTQSLAGRRRLCMRLKEAVC